MNTITQGDCLDVLKTLPDSSVDSIVTDPPYGISFMGKKWDYDVPSVEVWQEVLRVLKPGGHALVACGTRTQHRMAVNLEDAGFEIRDLIAWIYGSGFPKSLNIGKAVDKLQGNEREIVGKTQSIQFQEKGYEYKGNKKGNGFNNEKYWGFGNNVTKGQTAYEGWGTALKPAMELWTLARKPLSEKTVAKNMLKYGTGGINIDGCRIKIDENDKNQRHNSSTSHSTIWNSATYERGKTLQSAGRFPANVIHDGSDEAVSRFPNAGKSSGGRIGNKGSALNMMGQDYRAGNPGFGDSGSASRFFYCAKASKSERNKGLEGFEKVKSGMMEDDNYPIKTGSGNLRNTLNQNFHPTVKPVSLMRYLCRLITPVGGVVLDPFMGSGSTGIAAKIEMFNFIGIELEQEYVEIAEARIQAVQITQEVLL